MGMANFNGLCDLKLSQRNRADRFPLVPKSLPQPTLPSLTHRNWANAKTSLKYQFRAIDSKLEMEVSTSGYVQRSTLHQAPLFSHYRRVRGKKGESLTSILNQNGVPKGQDIKIQDPRAIIDRYQLQEKLQSSLNGLGKYKTNFTLAYPQLPHVRTTSLIVLVPLIVLCARSIINASYARIFGSSRLKIVNKPEGEHHKFRSGHWRSALRDIRELDGLDSESKLDSSSPSEEEQVSVEELSHAYKKLDQDYKRFLSECGFNK